MVDLKKQRGLLGLSQMRLSKLAGVSRFRLHLFENNYIQLTKSELKKITIAIKRGLARIRSKNV